MIFGEEKKKTGFKWDPNYSLKIERLIYQTIVRITEPTGEEKNGDLYGVTIGME